MASSPRTDDELSEFLLRACHDLRTPVRAVRAHAELLLKDGGAPQYSDFEQRLSFIVRGAVQADLLVDGLTNYSLALRISPASFQPVPLEVILRAVLAKLARELRESGGQVTYDNLPRVSGDSDRLMQLFENLVENAVRYRGPDTPRVHVTAELQDGNWLCRVRDNGPGIDAESLENIFRPFERLHGKDRPGPGLGLAICRTIVERHGGTIWAESKPGAGSVLCFTLPAE